MPYIPKFNITLTIAKNLMEIQQASTLVEQLPLPANILKELKRDSLVETIILSTKIEGNLLDENLKKVAMTKAGESTEEQEVYNLGKAMEFLEECEKRKLPITEELIKKLHAIIQVISSGRRPKLSEYRDFQNKVGEKGSGKIVYLPPEPHDVQPLMEDLVAWVNSPENINMPAPIKAGIFLYQFLTIHPYLDGNGRTGRALATYLLRLAGLGLNGLFVLEKYYDRNLKGYYDNLQMGLHHNYYFGRNDPDLTPWLEFFISGLNEVFQDAAMIVKEKSAQFTAVEPKILRELDVAQRQVFAQLAFKRTSITRKELIKLLELGDRTVRDRVNKWIKDGFLEPLNPEAKRIHALQLTSKYRKLADTLSKEMDKYIYLLK
ncbi:Fic family protein [Desulfotomaculum arcticum]|uniref:Fic family protein n=1 Tax=Desulfotruncus arcticus DSM 17038 TaxID=1121424 RepID=A0A1I2X7L1_9FIRM|nr:Fic family protein [Desulfotruncus arcticus]SFH09498.1 Fic family protein [Desulfotomaculum arcticum] [Desulfotruncus arcticus DSM 17038]